jgi:uncharacterized protein YndB with AHSA1/START domain
MTTGLTKDAGWEVGVSRTLPLSPAAVWDFVAGPEGVALWLGGGVGLPTGKGAAYRTADGVTGEIRSYRRGERIRLTYGTSIVQVTVSAPRSASRGASGADRGAGKRSVLGFHQERLADARERELRRAHWQAVMAEIEKALHVA